MNFYLNVTVAGIELAKRVCADYYEWFRKGDEVSLTLFFTDRAFISEVQRVAKGLEEPESEPIRIIADPVPFDQLHRFYGKKGLLNEWIPYCKGDIFRIYRLFEPVKSDKSYENQPVSIQFDIRYDRTAPSKYRVYRREHLAPVFSAIEYYRPKSMIDCGCGCGANYSFLEETVKTNGIRYLGVDKSRFLIGKAKELYEHEETDGLTRFTLGDVLHLPFADRSFDIAFSESLLPLVSHPFAALSEMARVARLGFFASLYTVSKPQKGLQYSRENRSYLLNVGAEWKYMNGVAEQIFYLPKTGEVREFARRFPHLALVENNRHQFFAALGIQTVNVFFYPNEWYQQRKTDFKHWNDRPLM